MSVSESSDSSIEYERKNVSKMEGGSLHSGMDIDDDQDLEDHSLSEKESLNCSSDDEDQTERRRGGIYKKNQGGKSSKSKVKIKTLTIDGQLVYFCKICDKIFTRRKDKLNHELAHSGESVLSCTECGKEYLHDSSLASHMRIHAGDPLYLCDLCPKMFAQSHHLKTHVLSHSAPSTFVCKTCYVEFPTSSDLSHHNRGQAKLEMTKYWCTMCKVFCCRSHNLLSDERLHAFQCSACSELFYTHKKLKIHVKKFAHFTTDKPNDIAPLQEHELYPDKLPEHMRKMAAQKENECAVKKPLKVDPNGSKSHLPESDIPLKRFTLSVRRLVLDGDHSSTSLQDSPPDAGRDTDLDLRSPTKNRKGKPYCKKCNKSFKDSVDLDRHKTLVHEAKQDSFLCEVCSMQFNSKKDLENHLHQHSSERRHCCPVCGLELPDSSQLTQHLRAHVEDLPYKCNQCGTGFKLKAQLIQHIQLHTEQTLATTEKGSRKFPSEETTDQFQRDGEFKCHLCNQCFDLKYKLVTHLRLHTNVKCFQCYVCHKTLATKSHLLRHLQVHVKQGMEVDVHNIVMARDSKTELECLKEQNVMDGSLLNMESSSRQPCLDFRRNEDMNKSAVGANRSVSNREVCLNDIPFSSDMPKENEHPVFSSSRSDVKIEIQGDSDSVSEHSFCSSFTRDSERSDPFRFSSDESYSFKTLMAKERRKLKRRWRINKNHFIQQDQQLGKNTKLSDLSEQLVEIASQAEEDVVDMMVELNAVNSEQDGMTTVYVTLTQPHSLDFKKVELSSIVEVDTPAATKTELNIKIEAGKEDESKPILIENVGNPQIETNCRPEDANQEISTEKMFMFEIDADAEQMFLDQAGEDVNNQHFLISPLSNQNQDKEVTSSMESTSVKIEEISTSTAPITSSPGLNLPPPAKRSPLKFINPDSNATSEVSNLGKLQAVFAQSSKYLPMPHIDSTTDSTQPRQDTLDTAAFASRETTPNTSEFSDLNYTGLPSRSLPDEPGTHSLQLTSDGKYQNLPTSVVENTVSHNSQNIEQKLVERHTPNIKCSDWNLPGRSSPGVYSEYLTTQIKVSESNNQTFIQNPLGKFLEITDTHARNDPPRQPSAASVPSEVSESFSKPIVSDRSYDKVGQSIIFSTSASITGLSQPLSHSSRSRKSHERLRELSSVHSASMGNTNNLVSGLQKAKGIEKQKSHTALSDGRNLFINTNQSLVNSSHSVIQFSPNPISSAQGTIIGSHLAGSVCDSRNSQTVFSKHNKAVNMLYSTASSGSGKMSVKNPTTIDSSSYKAIRPYHGTPSVHSSSINSAFSNANPSTCIVSTGLNTSFSHSSTNLGQKTTGTSPRVVQPKANINSGCTGKLGKLIKGQEGFSSGQSFTSSSHNTARSPHKTVSSGSKMVKSSQNTTSFSQGMRSSSSNASQGFECSSGFKVDNYLTGPQLRLGQDATSSAFVSVHSSHSSASSFHNSVNHSLPSANSSLNNSSSIPHTVGTGTRTQPVAGRTINLGHGTFMTSQGTSNSEYIVSNNSTNQVLPPSSVASFNLSANAGIPAGSSVGLSAPTVQGVQVINQDCLLLNPSTIFDASNPLYRDMNMMDLFGSAQAPTIKTLAPADANTSGQDQVNTQMKPGLISQMDIQAACMQPQQNFFINVGNPLPTMNLESFGNPFNATVNQVNASVNQLNTIINPVNNLINPGIQLNFGYSEPTVFNIGPGTLGGNESSFSQVYSSGLREDVTLVSGMPQFPVNFGTLGNIPAMHVANFLPINTGGSSNLNTSAAPNIYNPISINTGDLTNSFHGTNFLPFNSSGFPCDLQTVSANPYFIQNLSNNVLGVKVLDATAVPQNNELLPGSVLGFVNNFGQNYFLP